MMALGVAWHGAWVPSRAGAQINPNQTARPDFPLVTFARAGRTTDSGAHCCTYCCAWIRTHATIGLAVKGLTFFALWGNISDGRTVLLTGTDGTEELPKKACLIEWDAVVVPQHFTHDTPIFINRLRNWSSGLAFFFFLTK